MRGQGWGRPKPKPELDAMSIDELRAELMRAQLLNVWLRAQGFWWRLNIFLWTGRWL